MKILIVDDMNLMRMLIKDILWHNGYTEFYDAVNGREAVDMYKKIKPSLVFMDTAMPDVNGIEALISIKEFDADAKVIMMAASGEQTMVSDAMRYGALDFITKPLRSDSVMKVVQHIIEP